MRIRQNTYFLSFINIFEILKHWCDFFKNKRPLGLMATLLIIDLSVQPDCHYCKLIHNSLDGTVPIFLCAMFERNRNERNSQNLRSFYHKKKLYEQGVKYSGPHIWNKLPLSCKLSKTYRSFQKKFSFCNSVPCMSCAIWCETSLISSGSISNIMYSYCVCCMFH